MTGPPPGSALLGPLLSDDAAAGLFSDGAVLRSMLDFETALAAAGARVGVIPPEAAAAISAAAEALEPDWAGLGAGSARDGHPVAALVQQLRVAAGPAGAHVHAGATAQDVMDTALVLRLRALFDEFDERLRGLVGALASLARLHRTTVMAGRTRRQQAVPVPFGLKVAGWLGPLARHRARLAESRPRVLAVQLGGAAGTLSALGGRGTAVMEELAHELDLAVPPAPWHAQRDGLAEAAGWFSLVTGSLAKMGQDLALLAQTEVGEVGDGSGGRSSAMPHKCNPVRSEILVALGRANATLLASMHQAQIHEHERDGSAWTLEWLTLPQMAVLTGAALRHARAVAGSMEPDPARMRGNIEASGRLALAEAATIALRANSTAAESRRLVAEAASLARETGEDLIAILERAAPAAVDWNELREPGRWLGSADAFVERALEAAAQREGTPNGGRGPRRECADDLQYGQTRHRPSGPRM